MIGLITGTGFADLPDVVDRSTEVVATPYGEVTLTRGRWGSTPVVLLPRHGVDHSIPPHAIGYRANIWALREAGSAAVLATAVSGGISPALTTGTLVIIDDFLNFTSGRADTFFDGADGVVTHTDMTHPYDPGLRKLLLASAAAEGVEVVDGGVYCATNGPRFESPAEITMMGRLGGDLVGMTGYPEVVLSVEAGMPYASIGVVANPAAGLGGEALTVDDVTAVVARSADRLRRLIGRAVADWRPPA